MKTEYHMYVESASPSDIVGLVSTVTILEPYLLICDKKQILNNWVKYQIHAKEKKKSSDCVEEYRKVEAWN